MNKVILDTDIYSEITKRKNARIRDKELQYIAKFDILTVTIFTLVEVTSGLFRKRMFDRLTDFHANLSTLEVLPLTVDSALMAGQMHASLEQKGLIIGIVDCMIAAIALEHNLPIVSGNVSHFQFIRDVGYELKIENWRE